MTADSPARSAEGTLRRVFAAALVVLALLTACRGRDAEVDLPPDSSLTTLELGRVGGRIYNEPERTGEILEEVGLSAAEFEERVRSVTNDSALSDEYTRGFQEVARARERIDTVRAPANRSPETTGTLPPRGSP